MTCRSCRQIHKSCWHPLLLTIAFSLIHITSAHAGTQFFTSAPVPSDIQAAGSSSVQIVSTSAATFEPGFEVDITLPSGVTASGSVTGTTTDAPLMETQLQVTQTVIIPLNDNAGSISVHAQDDLVVAIRLFDRQTDAVYTAELDSAGRGELEVRNPDDFICHRMPVDDTFEPLGALPEQADVPDLAGLMNLEGDPASDNTIYINYWGGVLTGTQWNIDYFSNRAINYSAYDTDGNPGGFSATERYVMYMAWLEAVEDYAPFDVNVTTKQSVYDATPIANRSQIIATSTNNWLPGVGGVAYRFNSGAPTFGSGDRLATGWTFNLGIASMGMTHSHESGHQMGLQHDGGGGDGEYYTGHGRWGPVMGAPFGYEYVQWSRGEYVGANQPEDDLQIISNVLGQRVDDAGDTNPTAQVLNLPAIDTKGIVAPDGLVNDEDIYTFTLNADDPDASVEVATEVGAQLESVGANAALNVSLRDSSGTVVASIASADESLLSPFTNKLEYDGGLLAGTYFLSVESVSPDTDWATGFGEYGNGGQYRISVDASAGPEACDVESAPLKYALARNTWQMISLPCQPPAGETVETIFGDDIVDASYDPEDGVDIGWIVYSYDPAVVTETSMGAYDVVPYDAPLVAGQGYWIKQTVYDSVELDLPEGSMPLPLSFSATDCGDAIPCRSIDLTSLPVPDFKPGIEEGVWNMIGNQSADLGGVPYDNVSVVTTSAPCNTGDCTLDSSGAVVHETLYRYNGVDGFDRYESGSNLNIWEAYWIAEREASTGNGTRLAFTEGQPQFASQNN